MRTAPVIKVLGMVLVCATVGCTEEAVQGTERARVSSPQGIVDAILVTKDAGTTVAQPVEVHIVPKGSRALPSTMVMRGDHFENVSLVWKEERFLQVRYETGRVFSFRNFWQSSEIANFSYVVEIRLFPARDSFSIGRTDK